MKDKTINWGIIGLGKIAHKFAHDLLLVEGANLQGVASRHIDKATDFGNQYVTRNACGGMSIHKSILDAVI